MPGPIDEMPSNGFIRSVESIAGSNEANKTEPDIGLLRGRLYSRNSVKYRVLSKLASWIGTRESKESRELKLIAKFAQLQNSNELSSGAKELVDKIYRSGLERLLKKKDLFQVITDLSKIYGVLPEKAANKNEIAEKIVVSCTNLLQERIKTDEKDLNSESIYFFLHNVRHCMPDELHCSVYESLVPLLRVLLQNSKDPLPILSSMILPFQKVFSDYSSLGIALSLLKDNPKAEQILARLAAPTDATGKRSVFNFTAMKPGDKPIESRKELEVALKALQPHILALSNPSKLTYTEINEVRLKVGSGFDFSRDDYVLKSNDLQSTMANVFEDSSRFRYLAPAFAQAKPELVNAERYLVFTKSAYASTILFQLRDR